VAHVGLHRLLREEEPVTDLAVHEAVRDQLENLDLPRRGLLLQLLERAGERNYLGATRTTLRRFSWSAYPLSGMPLYATPLFT
jgi:hypothetical protein